MNKFENREVEEVFNTYPKHIYQKMMCLRQLVLDTASQSDGVGALEETLKWGEPSYLIKSGSTIRMDWKGSSPEKYALYFNCKTTLVDTFRELYSDALTFEGNRAIVFQRHEEVPIAAVMHCIFLSLTYHNRKHLPMLGAAR